MELQSGFVFAAIIAAVLFATRIGGNDDLARRLLQVALGVSIAFATVSTTTAFIRAPEPPDESSDSSSFDSSEDEEYAFFEDLADHGGTVTTVHAGIGMLVLLGGLAALRRMPVTSLGVALGGLLLLLFGGRGVDTGGADPASLFLASYGSLLGSFFGASSRWIDIAHFLVMAGGTIALGLFGYLQFDDSRSGEPGSSTTQQNMPE